MSPIEYHARIAWDDETISVDSELQGHPPSHTRLAWSLIEAHAVGKPDPTYPDGIYLLIRQAPHYEYITRRAAGSAALEGELRARGFPEWSAGDVMTEATRRRFIDLREEVAKAFGADGDAVWQKLEAEPALQMPNVRIAVARLAKGDAGRIDYYVDLARRDYRDVLLMAQLEQLV